MIKNRSRLGPLATGFTIVELLIVIVVIGILAAISIIAYNGIQGRAQASAVSSALDQTNRKLALYAVDNSAYPPDLATAGINNSGGTSYQYSFNNAVSPQTYCVTATDGTTSYFASSTANIPASGGCPGHGVGGVGAVTNLQVNPQLAVNSAQFATQTPAGNTFSRSTSGGPSGEATFDVATVVSGQLRIAFKNNSATLLVQPGDQYNMSFLLNSSVTSASASIEVNFSSPSVYVPFSIGNLSIGWNRYNTVVTVPAGVSNLLSAQLLTSGSVASGASFSMTKVQITKGPTLYNYADGSSPNWVWNGTPSNSTSTGPAL